MTITAVQNAAETFLQALDAAPTGTAPCSRISGRRSGWRRVCSALAKLDAVAYGSDENEGLDRMESSSKATMSDGTVLVLEHSVYAYTERGLTVQYRRKVQKCDMPSQWGVGRFHAETRGIEGINRTFVIQEADHAGRIKAI